MMSRLVRVRGPVVERDNAKHWAGVALLALRYDRPLGMPRRLAALGIAVRSRIAISMPAAPNLPGLGSPEGLPSATVREMKEGPSPFAIRC
jgi:hypothetical protein